MERTGSSNPGCSSLVKLTVTKCCDCSIGIGHPDDLMIINNSLNPSILGSVCFSSLRWLDLIPMTFLKDLRLIYAAFWPYSLEFTLGDGGTSPHLFPSDFPAS
jgi:hypothetical protein